MCWQDDKETMVEAYGMLYEIEMMVVHHIVDRFQEKYGACWYRYLNKPTDFDRANFNRLIKYLCDRIIFPDLTQSLYIKLKNIDSLRAKICDMKPLTLDEFQKLKICHAEATTAFNKEYVS